MEKNCQNCGHRFLHPDNVCLNCTSPYLNGVRSGPPSRWTPSGAVFTAGTGGGSNEQHPYITPYKPFTGGGSSYSTPEVIRVDNIRESLKELIVKAYVDGRNKDASKVDGGKIYILKWDHFTDYLLANGVTIQQWIPVSEGLPDPFETVWVYDATADETYAAHITYHKEWVGVCMSHEITHWMPPPSVPKPRLPK